ncbi:hypothetical protein AaE_005392 [Aphanomyces astaci]|uniref:Uncharacterized protein n=1 Tax=Aphanomyces astaci TaxID=112090 RepID=A0A6A5AJ31_APHAT|nr:hypothetical protein AaE_005392 [Aphanomyces astaci]
MRFGPGRVRLRLFSGWVRYHNAPAMESVSFIVAISGEAMDSAIQNIQDKALSLWMDGNYFWGPLNVLIFSVVPLPHRPLVSNAGNVVWTTYLSYRANQHIVHDGT